MTAPTRTSTRTTTRSSARTTPRTATTRTTRERLLRTMGAALRRGGLHRTGLTELLAEAEVPKGVLYHHFPGGKTQLAIAALDSSVEWIERGLSRELEEHGDPITAFERFAASWRDRLESTDFEEGCPLAGASASSRRADDGIRRAVADGFDRLRRSIAAALADAGLPDSEAEGTAAMLIACFDGALVQARAANSVVPMRQAIEAASALVRARLESAR